MKRKALIFLLVAVLAFIWGNSMLSGPVSTGVSETVTETVVKPAQQAATGETTVEDEQVRKWAHVVEFLVLGLLLGALLIEKGRVIKGALLAGNAALLAALIDESIQHVCGRTDQIKDVWRDFTGAACGIAVFWLAWAVFTGRKHE